MQTKEQQLIRKILKGDKSSFAQLIDRYQRLVSHIVYTQVKNSDDREDICQEVFMKVYVNLASFRSKSKLSTWIGRIAYNECMNYFTRNKQVLKDDCLCEDESEKTDNTAYLQSPEDNPQRILDKKESGRIIDQKMTELPGKYQAVLRLYHMDNLSYREIASILGVSVDNVKIMLFRARSMLRRKLLSEYQKEDLCL